MPEIVLGLLAALALAGSAAASDPGGHVADVGALAYVEGGDRGGGMLEGRFNLASKDPTAALYVTGALGTGSWLETNQPTGMNKTLDAIFIIPWLVKTVTGAYKSEADNFTEIRTQQRIYADLGLAATVKVWNFSGGLTFVNSSMDVLKRIGGVDFNTLQSFASHDWGGYFQAGLEIPIEAWFLDFAAGYRQTRGKQDVLVTNAAGGTEHAYVRPVDGLYGRLGLRYRFY